MREATLGAGIVTLEIGPGLGVLTSALLDAGHDVVAIERDARFLSHLETRFADRSFRLVRGDAAELDWMTLVGDREWQLVSNLPYAISSLALRFALWSHRPATNVVVMVQREVAERAIAQTPSGSPFVRGRDQKGSLLSLMVALASQDARIVRRVPPGAFYPPPKVDSAVLRIVPMPLQERVEKWGVNPEKIMQLAKQGFAHPRKLLASNLKIAASVLEKLQINPKARPEDVSPQEWAQLTRELMSAR